MASLLLRFLKEVAVAKLEVTLPERTKVDRSNTRRSEVLQ